MARLANKTPPAPEPGVVGQTLAPADWKWKAALALVQSLRAVVLEIDPATLSEHDTVVGFAIATKLKNLADRRVSAFRGAVNALFTGERALRTEDVSQILLEQVFFGPSHGVHGAMEGKIVAAKLQNGSFGKGTISESLAFELLKTKKASAKRMVMEKTPRPVQPPPRFSPQKFRELIAKGVITQAEYTACVVPLPPSPTMTVEVPPEIERAIAETLFRAPPPPDPES